MRRNSLSEDNGDSKLKRKSQTPSPIDQKRKKEIVSEMKRWLRPEGSERNLIPFEVHRLAVKRKFRYEWTAESKLGESKIKTLRLMFS